MKGDQRERRTQLNKPLLSPTGTSKTMHPLKSKMKLGLWLTLLLCGAGAQAHSPYLKPNTFHAEEQRKHVTVEASFAEGDLRPDVLPWPQGRGPLPSVPS